MSWVPLQIQNEDGSLDMETMNWLYYETESKGLSVDERSLLFRQAWDWGVKAHPERDGEYSKTRIMVRTQGIRGIRQRRCYYDLEDFVRLYNFVTRHRQCGTGLMRKGETCAKQVIQHV